MDPSYNNGAYHDPYYSQNDSSSRNKSHSVDHSNAHGLSPATKYPDQHAYIRAKSTQYSHDSSYAGQPQPQQQRQHYHSPYAPQENYNAAQMQQLQQQQQAKTHKIKKSRKHRQQNAADTPEPTPAFQDTQSVPIAHQQQYIEHNNNNSSHHHHPQQQQPKQSRRRQQPPQHMYNNDNNNNSHNYDDDDGYGNGNNVDVDTPPPKASKSRRRRTRSKSPYDDLGDHRDEEVRRTKHSVPNVASNVHMQMQPPQNHAVRHSSTPNAMTTVQTNGSSKKERKQRRRKKKDSVSTPDGDYDSTDSIPYQQRRVQSVNTAALEHVHEDRSESVSRTRKKKRRKKHDDDSGVDAAPIKQQQQQPATVDNSDRKRRHTTQVQAAPSQVPRSSHGGSSKKTTGRKKSAAKLDSTSNGPKEDDQWAKLNKGVLAKDYEIRDKLGKGSFSVVRRVVRRLDGAVFAAKIISTKTFQTNDLNEHLHEALILSELRHPNIVRLIEYKKTTRHLYLVLEMLNGGELFERLQGLKKFNEHKAAKITRQISDALAYMHGKGVVHRDLKPENIIFSSKREDALVKITDFGLSRNVKLSGGSLKTACGTPGYVAPEILRSQPYGEAVDLWALGVIIYILLCGFAPFSGQHQEQMFVKIKAGKYSYSDPVWSRITAVAKDCIDSLLVITAKDRMSAKELLQHPWIKMADREPDGTFEDIEFQQNLSTYLHKKRFRRGVRLIITLNRMIRGAGLEKRARQQRQEFRVRLAKHKEMEKAKQRFIWLKQKEAARLPPDQRNDEDYFLNYTVIDPDETPAIDYSKI